MFASVCRFYGWTLDYVWQMDMEDLRTMYLAMNILDSRERLVDFNVSAYPNLKKNAQDKLHREFYKTAFPVDESKIQEMSTEEVFKALAGV